MKLLGWTLDLQLQWKKPSPRMFTCEYISIFRASAERSYMSSVFLIKFRVVYHRAAALLRRWSTIDFFLRKILFLFFLTASFRYIFQKNLWWILFIAKLQPENCRFITLLKETPSLRFPREFSKLLQSIIFCNISICGEEGNYMKDYMKDRR